MIEGILRVFKQLLLLDYRSFYFLVLGDFGDKIKKRTDGINWKLLHHVVDCGIYDCTR